MSLTSSCHQKNRCLGRLRWRCWSCAFGVSHVFGFLVKGLKRDLSSLRIPVFLKHIDGIGEGKPLNCCVNGGPSCSVTYSESRYFSFKYPEHCLVFFFCGWGVKHDHLRYLENLFVKTYCNKTMIMAPPP